MVRGEVRSKDNADFGEIFYYTLADIQSLTQCSSFELWLILTHPDYL